MGAERSSSSREHSGEILPSVSVIPTVEASILYMKTERLCIKRKRYVQGCLQAWGMVLDLTDQQSLLIC